MNGMLKQVSTVSFFLGGVASIVRGVLCFKISRTNGSIRPEVLRSQLTIDPHFISKLTKS